MTIATPFPIQATQITYGASTVYGVLESLLAKGAGEGVVGAGDLAVTAPGGSLQVNVSGGQAFLFMNSPAGGVRWVSVTGPDASGPPGSPGASWLGTFLAADTTNPRVDRVVLKVRDHNVDSSGNYDGKFQVLAGTPTSGATLANLTGAAAVPSNSLLLANVLVPANATGLTSAEIDTLGDGFKQIRPRAFPWDVNLEVTRSATQSITSQTTFTAVQFDAASSDLDTMWRAAENTRVYARTPGWYSVRAHIVWAANASGTRAIQFLLENATGYAHHYNPVAATFAPGQFAEIGPILLGTASNNRYLELKVMQNSGGALNVTWAALWAQLTRRV